MLETAWSSKLAWVELNPRTTPAARPRTLSCQRARSMLTSSSLCATSRTYTGSMRENSESSKRGCLAGCVGGEIRGHRPRLHLRHPVGHRRTRSMTPKTDRSLSITGMTLTRRHPTGHEKHRKRSAMRAFYGALRAWIELPLVTLYTWMKLEYVLCLPACC
ncbi:hypothetical protein C8Q72DRAFT_865831 [Fomitopsis betulina]|nr:hypothetical protein C8Q72DRAFT_865831 [Fomitopsis betulina]